MTTSPNDPWIHVDAPADDTTDMIVAALAAVPAGEEAVLVAADQATLDRYTAALETVLHRHRTSDTEINHRPFVAYLPCGRRIYTRIPNARGTSLKGVHPGIIVVADPNPRTFVNDHGAELIEAARPGAKLWAITTPPASTPQFEPFGAWVEDAGGGKVTLSVDRDGPLECMTYPTGHVIVTPADPRHEVTIGFDHNGGLTTYAVIIDGTLGLTGTIPTPDYPVASPLRHPDAICSTAGGLALADTVFEAGVNMTTIMDVAGDRRALRGRDFNLLINGNRQTGIHHLVVSKHRDGKLAIHVLVSWKRTSSIDGLPQGGTYQVSIVRDTDGEVLYDIDAATLNASGSGRPYQFIEV